MMSDKGFLNHLYFTQKLFPFTSTQHHGVVCSPFVWLCRASTGRDEEYPTGFPSARNKHHTVMVNRSALIILIGWSKFIGEMYEQPGSSVMPHMPRLQKAARFIGMTETNTFLGSFGGETSKEIRLFCDRPFVQTRPNQRPILL